MSVFRSDEFHGPYLLSQYEETIHAGEIGVYVFLDKKDSPRYVGRSDSDLADRLQAWVGKYDKFWVEYHRSPRNAYYRECELFHQYRPQLDNERHPGVPKGTKWRCPVKDCEWA